MQIQRYKPQERIEIVYDESDFIPSNGEGCLLSLFFTLYTSAGYFIIEAHKADHIAFFVLTMIPLIPFIYLIKHTVNAFANDNRAPIKERELRYLLIDRSTQALELRTVDKGNVKLNKKINFDEFKGFELSIQDHLKSKKGNLLIDMLLKYKQDGAYHKLNFKYVMHQVSTRSKVIEFGEKVANVLAIEQGDITSNHPRGMLVRFQHQYYDQLNCPFKIEPDLGPEIISTVENSPDSFQPQAPLQDAPEPLKEEALELLEKEQSDESLELNQNSSEMETEQQLTTGRGVEESLDDLLVMNDWNPDTDFTMVSDDIIAYVPHERLTYELRKERGFYLSVSVMIGFMASVIHAVGFAILFASSPIPILKVLTTFLITFTLSILYWLIVVRPNEGEHDALVRRLDFKFKESLLTYSTSKGEKLYHLHEASHILLVVATIRTRSRVNGQSVQSANQYIASVSIIGLPEVESLKIMSTNRAFNNSSLVYHEALSFAHMISKASGLPLQIIDGPKR